MTRLCCLAAAAALAGTAPLALADENLDRLGRFQVTGVTDFTVIEQGGSRADAINAILEKIRLPPGFRIGLYAIVPDARHMAVGPQGVALFVGTRKTDVWVVTDRDKDRVADEVKSFAPSISFDIPNGPCFSKDGFLYIAERNRVLVYPAAEFFYESPDVAAFTVVADGALVPEAEESYNHTARVCAIGPDDRLYITLGQPFNVFPADKMDLYTETGIGGIISMNRDGTDRRVYSYGVRNSVGMAFDPVSGDLWFTDNQVDGMGDGIPPGELNHQTGPGQHFGFPWYGGGSVRTTEYSDSTPPDGVVFPAVEMDAHAADLGMTFYTGTQFPSKYRNGIFSAQHGSWNRTDPIGARIMFTPVDAEGNAGATEVFASGWLTDAGEYLGRPVDVKVLTDGSLLVSDDLSGAIYRIWYEN